MSGLTLSEILLICIALGVFGAMFFAFMIYVELRATSRGYLDEEGCLDPLPQPGRHANEESPSAD